MIKKTLLYTLFAFAMLSMLAACGPKSTPTPVVELTPTPSVGATPSPDPTPTAEPTSTPADKPAAPLVAEARADLAQRLDIDVEQIDVQNVESTEFPDASLGVPEPGKSYAQVVTPGYVIELSAAGQTYRYHAGDGRIVAVPEEREKPSDARITVKGVEATAERVVIHGTSTLPEGACVSAELWADGVPLPWWPTEACATVQDSAWELVVSLEPGQALQPGVQYMVRAYQPGGPNIVSTFPFDLNGPATPSQPSPTPEDDPALLPPESAEPLRRA